MSKSHNINRYENNIIVKDHIVDGEHIDFLFKETKVHAKQYKGVDDDVLFDFIKYRNDKNITKMYSEAVKYKEYCSGWRDFHPPSTCIRRQYNLCYDIKVSEELRRFGNKLYEHIESFDIPNLDLDSLWIHMWFNYFTNEDEHIEWHEHGTEKPDIVKIDLDKDMGNIPKGTLVYEPPPVILSGHYYIKSDGIYTEYKDEDINIIQDDGWCHIFRPSLPHRVLGGSDKRASIAFDIITNKDDKDLTMNVPPGGPQFYPLKYLKKGNPMTDWEIMKDDDELYGHRTREENHRLRDD
tara:strand:+ start:2240 stop:3124 length:885 start_codon:yes stop_codon:yes gene_type:complete